MNEPRMRNSSSKKRINVKIINSDPSLDIINVQRSGDKKEL